MYTLLLRRALILHHLLSAISCGAVATSMFIFLLYGGMRRDQRVLLTSVGHSTVRFSDCLLILLALLSSCEHCINSITYFEMARLRSKSEVLQDIQFAAQYVLRHLPNRLNTAGRVFDHIYAFQISMDLLRVAYWKMWSRQDRLGFVIYLLDIYSFGYRCPSVLPVLFFICLSFYNLY